MVLVFLFKISSSSNYLLQLDSFFSFSFTFVFFLFYLLLLLSYILFQFFHSFLSLFTLIEKCGIEGVGLPLFWSAKLPIDFSPGSGKGEYELLAHVFGDGVGGYSYWPADSGGLIVGVDAVRYGHRGGGDLFGDYLPHGWVDESQARCFIKMVPFALRASVEFWNLSILHCSFHCQLFVNPKFIPLKSWLMLVHTIIPPHDA